MINSTPHTLIIFYLKLLCIAAIILSACTVKSFSQNTDNTGALVPQNVLDWQESSLKQQQIFGDLQTRFNKLLENYRQNENDEKILLNIRQEAQDISEKIFQQALFWREPLQNINLQIEQFNKDNHQSNDLKILSEHRVQINKFLFGSENLFLKTNQLIENIANKRREIFTTALTQRISYDVDLFERIKKRSGESLIDSFAVIKISMIWLIQHKFMQLIIGVILAAIVACIALFVGDFLRKRIIKNYDQQNSSFYLTAVLVTLMRPLTAFFSTLFFFIILSTCLKINGPLGSDIQLIFDGFVRFIFIIVLISSVARAIFNAKNQQFSLFSLNPIDGRKIFFLLVLIAVIIAFNNFFAVIYQVIAAPLTMIIAKNLTMVLLVGIIMIGLSFCKIERSKNGEQNVPISKWIRFLLFLLGFIPILIALLGYLGLARFLIQTIVIDIVFLTLIYLGLTVARIFTLEGAFAQTYLGRRLVKRFNPKPTLLDQIGLLAGILIGIIVLLCFIPPILMQFGFSASEIFGALKRLLTGVHIGNVSISIIGIIIGICFFAICYFIIRGVINWFDRVILARGHVDIGIRNSIKTISGYGAVALAAIIGLSAAGINMSSLALIAGGLSLGIGFGLQNIVQNFVSGLILLAERPFKVGDLVETGSVKGVVKKVSVRATEIETSQRAVIIVPNSLLINGNVGNWTLYNKVGRIDLTFTISIIHNPPHVIAKLIEIANSVNIILKKPAPSVEITSIDGANAVYNLYVFVPDVTSTTAIKNQIRLEVFNFYYQNQENDD